MTRQALLKKRHKFRPQPVVLLPIAYSRPSRELEMVFNTETGELERG